MACGAVYRSLIIAAVGLCVGVAASPVRNARATPPVAQAGAATGPSAGFAPPDQTLFAPLVQLAPPGPSRAARALAIVDRQLAFQRKISFHPAFDTSVERVLDEMPPRPSTLIRAAALYVRSSIPWIRQPGGTRQISVAGGPRNADYFYRLTGEYQNPDTPEHFSGRWALQPTDGAAASVPDSVIGTLGGELLMDTYDIGAIVDVLAAVLAECYGDLHAPWDAAPGTFNQHDRALLERLHREMPRFAAKLDAHLRFYNVLDEFDSPAGPIVLFNLDVEARPDTLRKYPRLAEFYRRVLPDVTAQSALFDANGNNWLQVGLERGHLRVTLMVRDGRLAPFNAALQPAGKGVALNTIDQGSYRTLATMRTTSLGMSFGVTDIGFTTTYRRDADTVMFESRMNTVPKLVAPPVIHETMDLFAGKFLEVLATGQGGLTAYVTSRRLPGGMYRYGGSARAELYYAPPLAFVARIGDAFASKHDEEVRAEERAFGEELFDALVADYTAARSAILALDDGRAQ
jgi:hypothetical protein